MVRNKLHIAKNYHIQPSEIDNLPYYEYEMYLEEINIIAKKEEEQNEKQNEQYADMQSSMNPQKMMQQAQQNMPSMGNIKMPSFNNGSFQMPKVSIPKI